MASKELKFSMIGTKARRSFMSSHSFVAPHRRLRDHGYVRIKGIRDSCDDRYITTNFL
jgi:hypothetical protein